MFSNIRKARGCGGLVGGMFGDSADIDWSGTDHVSVSGGLQGRHDLQQ